MPFYLLLEIFPYSMVICPLSMFINVFWFLSNPPSVVLIAVDIFFFLLHQLLVYLS